MPDSEGKGAQPPAGPYGGCIDCVADALVARAVEVSEAELARARKRLDESDDAILDVLRRMARDLALRIVEKPIRRVRLTGRREPRLAVVRTRETFDLGHRSDCPLAAGSGAGAPSSTAITAPCPRLADGD